MKMSEYPFVKKSIKPSGYSLASDAIKRKDKTVPISVVKKMLREWDQEIGWTSTMVRKLRTTIDRYSP
jgi:hypothetical protein